jgi:hypothetical protein
VSEEAAKQIDREDLALRVAEAPQLAQGLASDAKIIGLVLPLPLPESSADALDPVLGANPPNQSLLGSLAQELSWQSAMAELLALVRVEGMAAAGAAAAAAGSQASGLELLLAVSPSELGVEAGLHPESQLHRVTLKPAPPTFVDGSFGDVDASVLSLQDKDLFGLESNPAGADDRAAGLLPVDTGEDLDIDLFGASISQGLTTLSRIDSSRADPGTNVPIDDDISTSASITNSGTEPLQQYASGLITLDKGSAKTVKLDLNAALKNAGEDNSLTVRGDGDDTLTLVGDWFLVSQDPVNSVSVYAYADSPVSVVADNVEVVLA